MSSDTGRSDAVPLFGYLPLGRIHADAAVKKTDCMDCRTEHVEHRR